MHRRADVNACGQAGGEQFARERVGGLPFRQRRQHQQCRLDRGAWQGAPMRFVVMLIVLAFPVLDVLATVRFARWTGIPTLAWFIASAAAGMLLLRHERIGFRARTLAALRGDQPLMRGLLDSGRKVLAALLLILPGVMSDVIALALLLLPINIGPPLATQWAGSGRKTIEGDYRRTE